jgi:hypothetical protein
MSDASYEAAQQMWDAAVPDEPYRDRDDDDRPASATHGRPQPTVRIVDIDTRLAEFAAQIAQLDAAERGIKP